MTESKLDESSILAHFDRLVDQGMVVYNDNYRIVNVSDKGFSVSVAGERHSLNQLIF